MLGILSLLVSCFSAEPKCKARKQAAVSDDEVSGAIAGIPTHYAGLGIYAQITPVVFSTSTKTLVQFVPPSNQRIVMNEWDCSFNGTSNTATPIEVDIVRQTSAGTSSSLTIRKRNPGDPETVQSTALQTFTAEPTDSGDVPLSEQVHPQTGYTWQPGYGREITIQGGGRLGVRLVTPGAGASATAREAGEE